MLYFVLRSCLLWQVYFDIKYFIDCFWLLTDWSKFDIVDVAKSFVFYFIINERISTDNNFRYWFVIKLLMFLNFLQTFKSLWFKKKFFNRHFLKNIFYELSCTITLSIYKTKVINFFRFLNILNKIMIKNLIPWHSIILVNSQTPFDEFFRKRRYIDFIKIRLCTLYFFVELVLGITNIRIFSIY